MAIETAAHKLAADLIDRRESINRELARNGVRFGIYHDGVYNDRLFPYDPIPRVIPSDEYDELERGLKQRVNALNAYLRDIYSEKRIVADGVVPEEFVYTSEGYLPQVNGVTPPGGVYAHIAGEDLVQGQDGRWWVLEDNLLVAVERDLVLDRRAVLVLQAALERHARRVRREKRHQVARRRDELLDLVEDVLDAALRRHDRGIVGKNLIDECRAVRAHAVSHAVDLAHDLLVEHEAV